MQIKIGKEQFELGVDLSNVENILTKSLPEKIISYFKHRKNIKNILLSIKQLRNECFKILLKNCKYKKYTLPVPRTPEQYKQDLESVKHIDSKLAYEFLDKRRDADYVEQDMLQRFYTENGGEENFISFYQKGLKMHQYLLQPFKIVYTYSKKDKAVFIIEQFRKSDNTYCLFGYCTKNFVLKKL